MIKQAEIKESGDGFARLFLFVVMSHEITREIKYSTQGEGGTLSGATLFYTKDKKMQGVIV